MFAIAHNGAAVYGGAEKATALILAGLQQRGHRVLYLCQAAAVAERVEELGIPAARVRLGGDAVLTDAILLAARLRGHAPDALLLGTFRKIWLGALAGRMARVPRIVARVGTPTDLPARWKYRTALRRWVHAVTVNAHEMRAPFLAAARGLEPDRLITVYKGVTPPARSRSRDAVRRELGVPADAPVVGTLARLVRAKRLDRLLHAVARLPERTHCIIAGDGPERNALRALAARLGLDARVHLPGFRRDIGDLLSALDVVAVTSDYEAMCNVMLEAMALGLPVVTTPVAGAAEALDPLPDGTAPGTIVGFDAAAIAAAIERLLADPDARARMAAAAAARARQRFGFERMIDEWEAILGDRAWGR